MLVAVNVKHSTFFVPGDFQTMFVVLRSAYTAGMMMYKRLNRSYKEQHLYENMHQHVTVLGVPAQARPPDTLLSAAGLHTLLCTSRPPGPRVAVQSTR